MKKKTLLTALLLGVAILTLSVASPTFAAEPTRGGPGGGDSTSGENGNQGTTGTVICDGTGDGIYDGTGDGIYDGTGDGICDGTGDGICDGTGDGICDGSGDCICDGTGDCLADGPYQQSAMMKNSHGMGFGR